jgi:hypothetical protein
MIGILLYLFVLIKSVSGNAWCLYCYCDDPEIRCGGTQLRALKMDLIGVPVPSGFYFLEITYTQWEENKDWLQPIFTSIIYPKQTLTTTAIWFTENSEQQAAATAPNSEPQYITMAHSTKRQTTTQKNKPQSQITDHNTDQRTTAPTTDLQSQEVSHSIKQHVTTRSSEPEDQTSLTIPEHIEQKSLAANLHLWVFPTIGGILVVLLGMGLGCVIGVIKRRRRRKQKWNMRGRYRRGAPRMFFSFEGEEDLDVGAVTSDTSRGGGLEMATFSRGTDPKNLLQTDV